MRIFKKEIIMTDIKEIKSAIITNYKRKIPDLSILKIDSDGITDSKKELSNKKEGSLLNLKSDITENNNREII